ncbi:MAG: methyltransferase [Alphaproteobacteria bacterium]|jgi:SAM-dependent methyltransferase|nr:methyltransferase [Alphaproteobacteria bacterium]
MLKCRSCSAGDLSSIIPLGRLPLANALMSAPPEQPSRIYNLEVMLCGKCGLAQLKDLIDPKDLFTDYVYFSSNSETMLQSAADLVDKIIPSINKDALVIEIASNDGYLLKNYVKKDISVLGIEPAQNIAKVANERGINTLCEFFSEHLAEQLSWDQQKADVIHANNVMAHIPDINGFAKGIKGLLKDHGQAIIEVPYFVDLVENMEFDTIYHEHVYYFAIKPLKRLFDSHGLEIFDVEKLSIHGGSLRLFLGHAGKHAVSKRVQSFLEKESGMDLFNLSLYLSFMKRLRKLKEDLRATLNQIKNEGKSIAAYGASAKGTTLLNFFEIGKDTIKFVVDRSPIKQGLFTPGTHIEIKDADTLNQESPDYTLLLTWNFADEILAQQSEYRAMGGKFILPLPEVRIV